jgi:hypothetical protein
MSFLAMISGPMVWCGLLNERLQDVSVCFVAFVRLSIDDCNCELFISFDVGSILIEGGQ